MWHKHAVWCQCVLSGTLVMAIASAFSWQTLTIYSDVYWTVIFCISTVVQFVAAEHGHWWLSIDQWQKMNVRRGFVFRCLIIAWTLTKWPVSVHAGLFPVYCAASLMLTNLQHFIIVPAVIYDVLFYSSPWMLMYTLVTFWSEKYFSKTIQTSLADVHIKSAYAYKALGILFESIVMWSLRCRHRFPYTFRWTPIWVSLVVMSFAILWSKYYIKETKVSRNAIISAAGHGMAASLTAAENCPVCRKCLTSLDMESSFGD